MDLDEDFSEFVSARWSSLYRLAYLLAASPSGAEDLLQTTLEKAYVRWGRISVMEHPEAYVRRMITTTLLSSRRRAWIGERPTDRIPEAGDDSDALAGVVSLVGLSCPPSVQPVRSRAADRAAPAVAVSFF